MKSATLLTSLMLIESLGAFFAYLLAGEYRKAVYWAGASIITATFVF